MRFLFVILISILFSSVSYSISQPRRVVNTQLVNQPPRNNIDFGAATGVRVNLQNNGIAATGLPWSTRQANNDADIAPPRNNMFFGAATGVRVNLQHNGLATTGLPWSTRQANNDADIAIQARQNLNVVERLLHERRNTQPQQPRNQRLAQLEQLLYSSRLSGNNRRRR
jgi:hypothetical protein